ncbi:MAG: hypothetical protein AAB019_03535 [Planctomycetota bacterium]
MTKMISGLLILFLIGCGISTPAPDRPYSSYPSTSQNTIQVESLKFFESGDNLPKTDQRTYSASFSQNTTRYVYYQIYAKNLLWNTRKHSVSITAKYYKPDGTLMGSPVLNYDILSDWEHINLWHGWGWKEAGYWEPGNYQVELWIGSDKITQNSFSIVADKKPPLKADSSGTIEFKSLKFFESDHANIIPRDQRKYDTTFSQRNTRYVYYEVGLKNLLSNVRKNNVLIIAKYYKPDGSLMGSPELKYEIPADWEGTDLWHGYGWKEAGHWESGLYRVELWVNNAKFGEGRFTIGGNKSPLLKTTPSETDEFEELRNRKRGNK